MKMGKKKYSKKRTLKGKKISVLLTTLLVGVAFLLGTWVERDYLSFSLIENYIKEVQLYIESIEIPSNDKSKDIKGNLSEIHFFDVGQGGSTLLQAYDGTNILIDTGRYDSDETEIINYLNDEIGVGGSIDLLIFTHNDADHIGNGDAVLEYFQVDEVWMNGVDHTSQTYSQVLDSIIDADVVYKEPLAGEAFDLGAFSIEVLNPIEDMENKSQNDASIATRISIGDSSIIQTGDVSGQIEERILKDYIGSLQSDIMVLGHHGSRTSTSKEWLQDVNPKVTVYQAGMGNVYEHPYKEVLNKVVDQSIEVYGTDKNGSIQINIKQDNQLEVFLEEEK